MFDFVRFSILCAFRRKLVAFLAILGVSLGSSLLVAMLSLSKGIETRFSQAFQRLSGTINIVAEGGNIFAQMVGVVSDPLPASYVEEIAAIKGVAKISSYVTAQIPSTSVGLPPLLGFSLTGIEEGGEDFLGSPAEKIIEGRSFEREEEVIVGAHLVADAKFMKQEIKVGRKFTIPLDQIGESIELTVVGIFETGSMTNDYGFIGRESLARKISQIPADKISGILVRVEDPGRANETAYQIESLFEGRGQKVSAFVPTDILEQLNSFMDILNIFLLAIALITSVAGGTAVMVVMLLSSFERRKEFGILKASGWSNGNIILSVLVTSLTLSLFGSLLGTGLGAGTAALLENYVEQEIISLTPEIFAWAFGVGLVTGIAGGIIPALNAARVSPIETLRSE